MARFEFNLSKLAAETRDAVDALIAQEVQAERMRLLLAIRHTCACRACKDTIAMLVKETT